MHSAIHKNENNKYLYIGIIILSVNSFHIINHTYSVLYKLPLIYNIDVIMPSMLH